MRSELSTLFCPVALSGTTRTAWSGQFSRKQHMLIPTRPGAGRAEPCPSPTRSSTRALWLLLPPRSSSPFSGSL